MSTAKHRRYDRPAALLGRPRITPLPPMPEIPVQELWDFVQQAYRSLDEASEGQDVSAELPKDT